MESIQGYFEEHRSLSLILAFVMTIVTLVYLKRRQSQENLWSRSNVKGVHKPWPIVRSLHDAMFKDRMQFEVDKRDKYGKIYGANLHGKDRIFIADAEIIRQIAIKDFDVFTNHQKNIFGNKYQQEFLVWLQDNHWKRVRSMMTPTFTSGKIRNMFKFLETQCSEDLILYLREKLNSQQKQQKQDGDSREKRGGHCVMNLLESFGMYSMDGISTCCYGLKLPRASILSDSQKTGSVATRDDLLGAIKKIEGFSTLRIVCLVLLPNWLLKLVGFKMTSEETFKPFIKRVEKLIEIRRRLSANNKKHDDLLQLLVDARLGDQVVSDETDSYENHHAALGSDSLATDQQKLLNSIGVAAGQPGAGNNEQQNNTTSIRYKLDDHEILAEAAFMLLAGYETTRYLLTNCAYVLSHFQSIQERLHQEVRKIAHYNESRQSYDFNYDELTSCAYLDAFISETLRFLPPAMHTDRVASRAYKIGKYDVVIPEGESLLFCIYAVHHDSDYWNEPEKFNPERFMPGQKEKIVPGSYIPFSLGPRHCIGMRFSLTESKLAVAKVLMNFKLLPAPNTSWPPRAQPISSLLKIKNPNAIVMVR